MKGTFVDADTHEAMELMQTNFTGALPVVQHCWESILSGTTHLTHYFTAIASTTAKQLRPDEAIYGASLAARAKFAQMLACEAKTQSNVVVNIFYPGGMQSRLYRQEQPANYSQFMDPAVVAATIIEKTLTTPRGIGVAHERDLPRGYNLKERVAVAT